MDVVKVVREGPTKLSVSKPGGSRMFVNGAARCLDRTMADGLVTFVVESDSSRPQLIVVSERDPESVEVLDSLPRHSSPDVVRELIERETPPKPLEPVDGRIIVDGAVLTVHAADRRMDFVVGSQKLPTVQDAEMTSGGADVHLSLPDRTRMHLVVGSHDLDATQKAIAVIRATNRDEADAASTRTTARWQYKVVKNLTANKLEETLNGYGKAGWELVSMTGLDGVVSITGNKLYAVLKKQI